MKFSLVFIRFKNELRMFLSLFRDKRTPKISKILIIITVIYLLSPIDIVPDYLPFAGWIDDIIIIPILLYIATLFIPKDVMNDNIQKVSKKKGNNKKSNIENAKEGEIVE